MSSNPSSNRRTKRRRATRKADVDYDRTADRPPFVSAFDDPSDAGRTVTLDDDAPDDKEGVDFYKEEMPPHYGKGQ
ncbi:Hypothetical Protein NG00_00688 [Corynebacterium camporealensis]|uniref:Uncharacterized protein n=1 Tax=Corynebacterium camporealensis TaxID=161896 RepID=A0A0F6QVA7_9CORY|nr:hypothetical protein [Corynebacterium camporealensis]AKE38737.1 hypothetical protein UL81_03810 [Corynebacterium camporealensis]AVH88015.1 Hypothetical Protein NG00_00688 [Corynebacterium camporealensis]MDY5841260.1 hypothetical protein [Corynebacterium camporealensis]